MYGSTLLNLGSGGPSYNAHLVHNPVISGTDKVVGSGALVLSPARSQYVQIPTFTSGGGGLSFAYWIKQTGPTSGTIFDFGNRGAEDSISAVVAWGQYAFNYVGNNSRLHSEEVSAVKGNDWTHIAWTVGRRGDWVLYVNGASESTYSSVFSPPPVTRSYNYIGWSNRSANSQFDGAIDEFYMFQTALSPDQVLQLYDEGEGVRVGLVLVQAGSFVTSVAIPIKALVILIVGCVTVRVDVLEYSKSPDDTLPLFGLFVAMYSRR